MSKLPHPLDALQQRLTPTIMVPRHGAFEQLDETGCRFLAASDGLWIELKTAWLYLRYPLAKQSAVVMPYGTVTPTIDFHYGAPPIDLLQRFEREARVTATKEMSAWITWSELSGFRYYPLDVQGGEPVLMECEHLVFKLHSRGHRPAYFADTDEAGNDGVYLAGVFGRCHEQAQDYQYRLCAKGLMLEMGDVFSMLAQ